MSKKRLWRRRTNGELNDCIGGENVINFIDAQRFDHIDRIIAKKIEKTLEWLPAVGRPHGDSRKTIQLGDMRRLGVRIWRQSVAEGL